MMQTIELQERLVIELCNTLDVVWDSIELHYENSVVDGYERAVYKAFYFADEVKYQFGLSAECHDCLFELCDGRPENDAETWTWFDLKIDNTSSYAFDFAYDTPLVAEERAGTPCTLP